MKRKRSPLSGLAFALCAGTLLGSLAVADTRIPAGSSWLYVKGSAEASDPSDAWRELDYDDSGWTSVTAPVGYPSGSVNTYLPDMSGGYSTIFLRKSFTVTALDEETRLRAAVKYDDGFIMWINGERVWDENEPDGPPAHDSLGAYGGTSGAYETNALPDPEGYLEIGENVVAVQVFNASLSSSDCYLDAELETYKKVADTTFSHDRGFYDASFVCTIRSATPGARITYTLDGSDPRTGGDTVSGDAPLTVTIDPASTSHRAINGGKAPCVVLRAFAYHPTDTEYEPTDVDTQTYLFLGEVPDQANVMAGEDWVPGQPGTYSTAQLLERDPARRRDTRMDAGLAASPTWRGLIEDGLQAIPTISISAPYADIFGNAAGVFHNSLSYGTNWERACSAEFVFPDSPSENFQIDCGVTVAGGGHRDPKGKSKMSMNLKFRSRYGPSKLRYKLFKDTNVDEFDQIRLRAPGNDKLNPLSQYIRDEWGRDTQRALGGVAACGTWAHVYINGMYWGVYNAAEKPTSSFMASHFGGDDADYDLITNQRWYQCVPTPPPGERVVDGNDDAWDAMISYAKNNNLATAGNYQQMRGYLDITSYIDYTLQGMWGGDGDWSPPSRAEPGKNFRAGRKSRNRRPSDPQYTWFVWDYEGTMYMWSLTQLTRDITTHYGIGTLHEQMEVNPDYSMEFADRLYRAFLAPGAPMLPSANQARYQAIVDEFEPALICELARWTHARSGVSDPYDPPIDPLTARDEWYTIKNKVMDEWFPQRNGIVLNQFRNVTPRMYPSIEPPEFQQHGGAISAGFSLTMTNPNGATGTMFYKQDGSDPRASGGTKASGAVQYASAVALGRTTHVRARVYKSNNTWSAVHAATYNYTAHHPLLKISEIHYNPLSGGEYEFVELQNISGGTTVGLSEMTFDKGLSYTFAPGAELGPGKFAVLVRNESVFTNRYPAVKGAADVEIFGVYAGALDNGGERLTLMDNAGNTVTSVRYNDKDPWPGEADGNGFSLVWAGTGDQDDPQKWRASNLIGGSPGYDEGAAYRVVINEALTHTDPPSVDTIELHNVGDTSVDIGGWWLSDSDNDYQKYEIPSHLLGAGGYKTFDESDFNTDTNDPSCFALNSHGDEIYLTKWDAHGNLQYLAEARFGGAENARAFGRYIKSDGDADFVAQSETNTLGSANAYPLVGPVVINEFMYHPARGGDEFIELKNISDAPVQLYDPAVPTNTWRLDGAIEYMFPTGVVMEAGEIILVVATNSRTGFRTKYSVPAEVDIYKQYVGVLNNGGESLKLWRPDTPDVEGTPWILVDRVKYNDNSPWPESADGRGPSLERLAPSLYGNDVANWTASAQSNGTPGGANSGMLVSKTTGWKYHDRGADLGTGWRATGHDDSAWEDGNAPLGYPDTNLEIDTEVDFGGDPGDKHTTTYFRKAFLSDAEQAEVPSLTLRIRYDDGYVAYLNGQEVARGGMAAGTVNYNTLANVNGGSGTAYEPVNLDAHINKLVQGLNVLAVEIHQVSASSSDIFMDLELEHEVQEQGHVATPTFSPPAGTFTNSVNVTISSATSGATVFYTTDGADPSDSSYDGSGLNSVLVALSASRTLKAKAYTDGLLASHTASAQYTKYLPQVGFDSAASSGGEETNGSLTVELTAASAAQVRVNYAVSGGSAAGNGTDYTLAAGTLTFTPGQTSKPIAILVVDDDDEEGNETVEVTLSGAVNADLGTAVHTYTIEDDDAPVVLFAAYNDLGWASGQPDTNITKYSRAESGLLVDYPSGTPTAVTLTVDTGGAGPWLQGAHPAAGTDAHDVFDGVVDCAGLISYADTNVTLSFSGMDPALAYTLVLYNNRDKYEARNTKYILSGADSFANQSSAGATISTVSMPNDATQIIASNTVNGFVAKYTQIKPGPDGSIVVSVDGTQPYVNALMLQGIQMPGPTMDVVVAQGADWRYRKGSAEASSPVSAWRARQFDDSGWAIDPASFGYGSASYGTTLDMADNYASVFFRKSFAVSDAERVNRVDLKIYHDDGFILWLNGRELIRHNVQGSTGDFVAHDATCTGYVGGTPATHAVTIEGAALPELLSAGNTVAVQLFNNSLSSSDAYFDAEVAVARSELSASVDTDANGLRDDWQAAQGTTQPASVDEDGDGLSNLNEYVLGTGATDSNSFFAVDLELSGSDLIVTFDAQPATGTGYDGLGLTRHFQLQSRAGLDAPSDWAPVAGHEDITGVGQTVAYTNTVPGGPAYYRTRVWLED